MERVIGEGGLREEFREYSVSNESMGAIMAGLAVKKSDRVLTVGVDQAFAFLEKAEQVTCVDYEIYYLALIRQREKYLRDGNFEGFLKFDVKKTDGSFAERRRRYFSASGRMEKIRSKLDRLTMVSTVADVVWYVTAHGREFNKIYLSNTIGGFLYSQQEEATGALRDMVRGTNKGTLIYVTAHYPNWEDKLPKGLIVDERLTKVAKAKEEVGFWNPRVYRRV